MNDTVSSGITVPLDGADSLSIEIAADGHCTARMDTDMGGASIALTINLGRSSLAELIDYLKSLDLEEVQENE